MPTLADLLAILAGAPGSNLGLPGSTLTIDALGNIIPSQPRASFLSRNARRLLSSAAGAAVSALVPRPFQGMAQTVFGSLIEPETSVSKTISLAGGVEETWIGPKGIQARRKRRNAEREQEGILRESILFGSAATVGPGAFNAAERIRECQWYTTGTFTAGWNEAANRQGECNYAICAPYWPSAADQLRKQFFSNNNAPEPTTRIASVGVWEANATWTFQCGTLDPAELTVWALWPKHDMVAAREVNQDSFWFTFDPNVVGQGPFSHGIFRHANETPAGATPVSILVPTFDVLTGSAPTTVNINMPDAMVKCFTDTKVNSAAYGGAQGWDERHYYNSPQDFKCLTENFDIKPVYHRWMRAGDVSILHASCPWSFQVGNQQGLINRDPHPEEKKNEEQRDEVFYSWRKKYGPLYLFRVRGSIVFNSAENTDSKDYVPIQGVNMGAALLNHVSRYEMKVSSIPYPQEQFIYQSGVSTMLQTQDNFNFADERHATLDAPAIDAHQ